MKGITLLVVVGCVALVASLSSARVEGTTPNSLLTNGSFESGAYDPNGSPTGWTKSAFDPPNATFTWDNTTAFVGSKSVKIVATAANDAHWSQTVSVQPNTDYMLTGWIKTENVAGGAGANLALNGRWDHTAGLFGTNDWTYAKLAFNSGTDTQVTPAGRIGFWSATATGTVWFDDLRLERASCDTAYPQDFFRGCFFSGTNPATGTFLGSELEDNLGSPAPDRAFGVNRDWGTGRVFADVTDQISGTWRGSIYLTGGRYLFNVVVSDGVRLYVDESLVLDKWIAQENDYAVPFELKTGYHNFRIEWFEGPDPWWSGAWLRVHWDKVRANDLLTNVGFESGVYDPSGSPTGWTKSAFDPPNATFTWDNTTAFVGSKSVKIAATASNDAHWSQTVSVQPNTDYMLTGWIKTENVAGGAGANLALNGRWDHTVGLFGTNDWTYAKLAFNSGTDTQVTPAGRIGFWSATATGTVWFDDLRLERVSPLTVDAFIVRQQDVCIAGTQWTSGAPFNIYLNGSAVDQWQIVGNEPVILKPSDPNLANYTKTRCYSFGNRADELAYIYAQLAQWETNVESWTYGTIDMIVQTTEVPQGEILLTRLGGGLSLFASNIAGRAKPSTSSDTDVVIGLGSVHDVNTGHYYDVPACGFNFGPGRNLGGLWGAPYFWIPNSTNPGAWFQCLDDQVLSYEWNHTMDDVLYNVMLLQNRIDPPWPPCGQGNPDTYRWYPNSNQFIQDPASAWCGFSPHPGNRVGVAQNLALHFDHSLAHYSLNYFTGNHCSDGTQNFGETGIDTGVGYCPGQAPAVSVAQPANGEVVAGVYRIIATADDYEVQRVEFRIGGALVKTDTIAPYDYDWDSRTVPDGSSRTIEVRAYDFGGLNSSASVTVTIESKCAGQTVTVWGTSGNEVITGTSGIDVIHGAGGNDTISSLAGNDTVCGGYGTDGLSGGDGKDKLYGGYGDDSLDGGLKVDTCDGGPHIAGDTAVNCETVVNVP